MAVNSLVLTKGVPDFSEGAVSFDEDGHLERGKTPTVMNPNDEPALRAALATKVVHGGEVGVMSMGPPGYKDVLREAMETVYADHVYLLSDREMAAADTWATAITVSAGVEKLSEERAEPDLLFAGFKTADGETGHTGPQTAWCLDRPLVTHVVSLELDPDAGRLRAERLVEAGADEVETVSAPLPATVVVDPSFEPTYRTAGHRLRHKDLRAETGERVENIGEHATQWSAADLDLDPEYIGLDGSPTIVSSVDPIPKAPSDRETTVVSPDDPAGMERVVEALEPYAGGD